jgi:hypothetical protein
MNQSIDANVFTAMQRTGPGLTSYVRWVFNKSLPLRSIIILIMMLLSMATSTPLAHAATFDVNETSDAGDADLGDNVCDSDLDTPGLQCMLRTAIEQANTLVGSDNINLAVPGPYNLTIGQLLVTSQITVNGSGSTIRRMSATNFRIFNVTGTGDLTLNDVTVRDGNVVGSGGGILINSGGIVNILNSTISNNTAISGGGIFNNGTLNILNSAIANNTTTLWGGGITNTDGTLNIANSTISGNIADHDGGGLDNTGAGVGIANLTHVAITNNTANNNFNFPGTGGGIFNYGSNTVNLKNCIVAGNFDTPNNVGPSFNKPDIGGTISSHGYNLIGNVGSTSFSSEPGDQLGTGDSPIDPLLDGLRGDPPYHPLQADSPAIDQIPVAHCTFISSVTNPLFSDEASINTDQRGAVRPTNGDNNDTTTCDIGAYEFVPPLIYLPIILEN